MKVNIKNYTSETKADASISKIERLLVEAGARDIRKSYNDDHHATGIAFTLPMDGKQLTFALTAKMDALYKLFLSTYVKPTDRSLEICREQSERTAWKILAEWVEIQITMIRLEQAEVLQVFFPYLSDGKQTFYDKLKENNFKQLSQ